MALFSRSLLARVTTRSSFALAAQQAGAHRNYEATSAPSSVCFPRQSALGNAAKVSKWYVCEGQELKPYDRVCDLSSGDVTYTVTSPYHGIVHKVVLEQGSDAFLGNSLMEMNLYDPMDAEPELDYYGTRDPKYATATTDKEALAQ